ncbi:hypothetical protein ALC62_07095 [Cyphomyrmex costatus]|uniref:Uncharacterized protein n=1 Tax=Cyphomyrmex costatus TaxID=456900 RepID=A0A195CN61_9HYME|nr:hypothetical protein ALC62_07095 [Cyphomyrmex costatus]
MQNGDENVAVVIGCGNARITQRSRRHILPYLFTALLAHGAIYEDKDETGAAPAGDKSRDDRSTSEREEVDKLPGGVMKMT